MNEVNLKIKELKKVAKSNGLEVTFHNHRTSAGDFCIFIYDKSIRNGYLVGYDGNWDGNASFNQCVTSAYHWIENRDKRFKKVNGKWVLLQ